MPDLQDMSDPLDELTTDHRNAERLFQQFETATETGRGDDAEQALAEIVRELSVHAAVEEQLLYPAMRRALPDGDSAVEEALAEHQQVKEVLARLDGADADDPAVVSEVRSLVLAVRSHVTEEEGRLFPELRKSISPQAFTEMHEQLGKVRAMAPTRPHPKAPSTPPGNVMAGAGASLVDKARDAVRAAADKVKGKVGDADGGES